MPYGKIMADDSMEEDAVEMTEEEANRVKGRFLLRGDVYIFKDHNESLEKRIDELVNDLKRTPSDQEKRDELEQEICLQDQEIFKARDELDKVLDWEEANRVKDRNESMEKSIIERLDYLKKNPSDKKKQEEVDGMIRFLQQEEAAADKVRLEMEEEEEERIQNVEQTGFRETEKERKIREISDEEAAEEERIQQGYEEWEAETPRCDGGCGKIGTGECDGCSNIFCSGCLNEDWICGRCSGKWDAEAKERADDDLSCA